MQPIPIYIKTDPNMPRPKDAIYYLFSSNGLFIGRNHPFFTSEVPAPRMPNSVLPHQSSCRVRFPKLGQAALEYIVGFFDRVYQEHGAEAIVLLFWNQQQKRYKLWVPEQTATVWESADGRRSALDVKYEVPVPFPEGYVLAADIHCHCEYGAGSSTTDHIDERFRDGVHAIVGRIDREPPEFSIEICVDGTRFTMRFDQLFRGYERRRTHIPDRWMEAVRVEVLKPKPWKPIRSTSSNRVQQRLS